MVLHSHVQQSPGSHCAVVDSGTSMHILQHRLFTSNLSQDHTAVSGFSGNTSTATHRGDFNCVVRAQSGRLIHLVDPSAALVIPDSHRNLYSVRHAQNSGHTVILGAQAGLLPYGDPDLFVPFLEDKSTGLWLLPPLSNHFALNTEIQQPPVKPIFSHNGRFNAHTDVFNKNGRFAKNFETETLSTACAFTPATKST